MASLLPVRVLRHPLARAVLGGVPGERHPMAPAAVRIERSRARRHGETAEQTAVTVWFGEGPQLPGPGSGGRSPWRALAGVGATLAGAAALAAATTLAAERDERRRLAAAKPVRAIEASQPAAEA